jgi:ketosteroid isomerase-like protein
VVAGTDIQIELERFFQSYAAAYNALDAASVARHIAAPSLLVEQATTMWSTAADVLGAMERLVAFYSSKGFKSASFAIDRLVQQGADDAVVDVIWTIERTGAAPWHFRTGYNVHRSDGTWRIVVCTAYEEPAVRQPV